MSTGEGASLTLSPRSTPINRYAPKSVSQQLQLPKPLNFPRTSLANTVEAPPPSITTTEATTTTTPTTTTTTTTTETTITEAPPPPVPPTTMLPQFIFKWMTPSVPTAPLFFTLPTTTTSVPPQTHISTEVMPPQFAITNAPVRFVALIRGGNPSEPGNEQWVWHDSESNAGRHRHTTTTTTTTTTTIPPTVSTFRRRVFRPNAIRPVFISSEARSQRLRQQQASIEAMRQRARVGDRFSSRWVGSVTFDRPMSTLTVSKSSGSRFLSAVPR
ncbi:hypothetical protein Y032_0008g69 [Ancylostoma ceylanicum]|uniref:Uncharacterized protein n=1 Tax=Ancylostoma ceylanicum TaxID=53326 RepID=A0A016VMK9_9BILA|nr:hypothetical protein Y032_0008g69 [Ancylostoma ceylanicum]